MGNTTGSCSSTVVVPENEGLESRSPPMKRQDESVIVNFKPGIRDDEETCCTSQVRSSSPECNFLYKYHCQMGFKGDKRSDSISNLQECDLSESSTARKKPLRGCSKGRGRKRSSAPQHYRGWFTWLRLGC